MSMVEYEAQTCRDCGATFPYDPDADRCTSCVAAALGDDEAVVREALTHQIYPGARDFGLDAVARSFASFDNLMARLRAAEKVQT